MKVETKNKKLTLAILLFGGAALVVLLIVSIIWAKRETNIKIRPFVDTGTVVEADTEIEVLRTAETSAELSISSAISDRVQGMSSKLDTAKTFQELVEACDSIVQKNEKITIPKGAGVVEFEGIRVYTWVRTAEKGFADIKTSKIYVVMIYDSQYVAASCSADFLASEVSVETGTCQ